MENYTEIEMNEDMTVDCEFNPVEVETEGSGMSKLVALAIVACGAVIGGGVTWLGKKLWNNHKARKELRQPDEEEVIEVTDEQIEEVTAE